MSVVFGAVSRCVLRVQVCLHVALGAGGYPRITCTWACIALTHSHCDYLLQSGWEDLVCGENCLVSVEFCALSARRNDCSPYLRLMALNNTVERSCKKNSAFMEIKMGPDATFEHNYIQIVDKQLYNHV